MLSYMPSVEAGSKSFGINHHPPHDVEKLVGVDSSMMVAFTSNNLGPHNSQSFYVFLMKMVTALTITKSFDLGDLDFWCVIPTLPFMVFYVINVLNNITSTSVIVDNTLVQIE